MQAAQLCNQITIRGTHRAPVNNSAAFQHIVLSVGGSKWKSVLYNLYSGIIINCITVLYWPYCTVILTVINKYNIPPHMLVCMKIQQLVEGPVVNTALGYASCCINHSTSLSCSIFHAYMQQCLNYSIGKSPCVQFGCLESIHSVDSLVRVNWSSMDALRLL